MKNYKTWYWTAVVFQFLTAGVHALSLVNAPQAENETEKQLIDLMSSYKMNLAGSMITMQELFTALSSCFSFAYLLGALTNLWLLRKTQDETVLGGILWINILLFGVVFCVMAVYTFPPPIIMTGLVLFFLVLAAVVRRLAPR